MDNPTKPSLLDGKPLPSSVPYHNLGTFHRQVSTSSPDCQEWFNRGLIWIYAFHHEEAEVCLDTAIAHDPTCVMAYWALGYCLGANYNLSWETREPADIEFKLKKIRWAIDTASQHLAGASAVERALLEAMKSRDPAFNDPRLKSDKEAVFKEYKLSFIKAMEKVYEEYGDDLDVAGIYADSMAVLTPWRMWDLKTGAPNPDGFAPIIQNVLEKALCTPKGSMHIYILHLYIHLMELSPVPEKTIPIADRLLGMVPDAAHLNHMPSHIDVLMGDYRRAVYSNALAIVWDEKWRDLAGIENVYTMYRFHNYQSIIYASMFTAQYGIAMQYCQAMESGIPPHLIQSAPDFYDGVKATRFHILVRFGKWKEILSAPFPENRELECVTTALQHYARGIAFSAMGDVEPAEEEYSALVKILEIVPDSRIIFPNKAIDVLRIGEAMLHGELEYRKKNYEEAFTHLRTAIDRYDGLVYGEPWSWMQPVRHAYAALQLEQGNVEVALKTYGEDLGYEKGMVRAHQHPNNVWALHGYVECLQRLKRDDLAQFVLPQLKMALEVADVKIESSCYCRLRGGDGEELYKGGAQSVGNGNGACC